MSPKLLVVVMAGVGIVLNAAGCGGGPKIPETVAVSGKVFYKDKPLAGAQIGFISKLDNNKDVLPARGMTNAAGEFTLATYIDPQHEVSGATPGEFVVIVEKTEEMDAEKVMKEFQQNPAFEPKKLIPDKYGNSGESPLTATVTKGAKNSFEFKLVD